MDYSYIRGEGSPDYAKNIIWNILHGYTDEHSQRIFGEFPGDEVKDISIFQSQCANMTFSNQIVFNIMFQQVVHKGGESDINYIKRFWNVKALEISLVNSYTEDQLMHTLFKNFQQGEKNSSQIARTQA